MERAVVRDPKYPKRLWYIALPNELFCDLDLRGSTLERLLTVRARLRGARAQGKLDWEFWVPYQSETPNHYHVMIKLKHDLNPYERLLWESRFLDDGYRNDMNFARLQATGNAWSLLITPFERRNYWRPFDYSCTCPAKHKSDVMKNCPVAQKLQCTLSADHFGDPIKLDDELLPNRIYTE